MLTKPSKYDWMAAQAGNNLRSLYKREINIYVVNKDCIYESAKARSYFRTH